MRHELLKRSIRSPLGRKLIKWLLIFGCLSAALITLLNGIGHYRTQVTSLEGQFTDIESRELEAIIQSTWSTNGKETYLQLKSLVDLPYINYATIITSGEKWVEVGDKTTENSIERTFPLTYIENNRGYDIGVLVVSASQVDLWNNVIDAVINSLVLNLVFMAFLVVAVFVLIDVLITRHVLSTAYYVDSLQPGDQKPDLALDYLSTDKDDEILRLVKSVNSLKNNLFSYVSRLGDSEDRYRAIADYTYDWESWLHPDGSLNWVNPAVERITGFGQQECMMMNGYPLPIIDERDREMAGHMFDDMISNRTSGNDIYLRICRKDGERGIVAISWQPIYNNKNEYVGIRSSIRDVTERRRAELSLIESENRYRTLVENIPGVTYRCRNDDAYTMLFISNGIEAISGYKAADFVSSRIVAFASIIHPDDIDYVSGAINDAVNKRTPYTVKYRIVRKDGGISYIFERGQQVEPGILEGVLLNITEQEVASEGMRRQQQEKDLILDTMIDAVICIDVTGRITSANSAASNVFGYSEKELLSMNVESLMPSNDARHHAAYLANHNKTGKSSVVGVGRELVGIKKDGSRFPMRLSVAKMVGNEGRIERFIGVCHDLTNEKAQESQIRRAQKMDALGKLTGGIAHDFNNTLGIMLGYSQILERKLTDEKCQGFAHEITKAGERAKNLTSKLLTFSRQRDSKKRVFDLNEVIEEEKDVLEKTLTARIRLVISASEDIGLVNLDDSVLVDAILNMTINAMHAMPERGSLEISTSPAHVDDGMAHELEVPVGEYVQLCISDNGTGMPQEVLQNIFDPFFTTKGEAGTGLGMSQVYGFVKESGGGIKIYSEPDAGTTINIYFPVYREGELAKEKGEGEENDLYKASVDKKILVVDDEEPLVMLASELLGAYGFSVVTATTAEEALKLLENDSFDLLLTDVIMPNMDGYELAEKVIEKYPNTKIQLVSGYSDSQNRHRVDATLHQSCLRKPYTNDELLKVIHTHLAN